MWATNLIENLKMNTQVRLSQQQHISLDTCVCQQLVVRPQPLPGHFTFLHSSSPAVTFYTFWNFIQDQKFRGPAVKKITFESGPQELCFWCPKYLPKKRELSNNVPLIVVICYFNLENMFWIQIKSCILQGCCNLAKKKENAGISMNFS